MRVRAFGAALLTLMLAWLAAVPSAMAGDKYAVILQAGKKSHEGSARAVHAFLYAKELKEHGHEVLLIFDGAGTEWAEELSNPGSTSKLKPAYDGLMEQGIVEIICDFCANAFKVKAPLVERERPLVGEYEGHPSIAKLVDEGYQLLIL